MAGEAIETCPCMPTLVARYGSDMQGDLVTDTAVGLVNDSGKFVLDLSDLEMECR